MPIPGQTTPALRLETLDHGRFDLGTSAGEAGTLVLFYRGLHCPVCMKQLKEFDDQLDAFAQLGVNVVAVSADGAKRSRATAGKAGLTKLPLAHSLSLDAARSDWGLYISTARAGSEEPAYFNEPGLFYVGPDRTLYFAWVQSVPFARPHAEDLLAGIKFVQAHDYPPRGTFDGALPGAAA